MHEREREGMSGVPLTYVLPIRRTTGGATDELDRYLRWLAAEVELIVVDGSPLELFRENARRWPSLLHVPPHPSLQRPSGKVWGVLTGLSLASHERVVIADDDVRYTAETLAQVVKLLDVADVVRPQNYFDPAPWHARWDTGRTLINRVLGGDWPGTLAVRRSFLPDGYAGDSLFENLEMVRTIQAAGGRECVALDTFVRRVPPTTKHFFSQRVRQAYDEWARPRRLLAQLALLPLAVWTARSRPYALVPLALSSVVLAELGRRRGSGSTIWPATAALAAPLWVGERMICAWLAVLTRAFRGGVPYNGTVLSKAATPLRELKADSLARRAQGLP